MNSTIKQNFKPNTPETVEQFLTRLHQWSFFNNALEEIADQLVRLQTHNNHTMGTLRGTTLNQYGNKEQLISRMLNFLLDVPITYPKAFSYIGKAAYKRSDPKKSWIKITNLPMTETTYVDTVYHEIAHLIKHMFFEPSKGSHCSAWKTIAVILGAMPLAISTRPDQLLTESIELHSKPTARCNSCGFVYTRVRHRPDFWRKAFCHKCCVPLQTACWSKDGYYWEVMPTPIRLRTDKRSKTQDIHN
jgi:hypothetical protein